ncbi:6-phosphogluconolactonase [Embleya sp. AB8]|uniref:6-phosphogluconolactonase n=1 Tax=Embleya sp. AB8 TaxID=3156304 RepID=UPI003C772097
MGRPVPATRHRNLRTADELADVAAAQLRSWIRHTSRRKGSCVLALAGGSTPAATYRLLAAGELPLDRLHIVQTDERVSTDPAGTAASVIEANLIGPAAIPADHWHPLWLPPEHDPDAAAATYGRTLIRLRPAGVPDIAVLGLGTDGHTASLFGECPPPADAGPVAAVGPYQGSIRVTLTSRVLRRAEHRMVLASGPGKAPAVARLLSGATTAADTAATVLDPDGLLLTDHAAARPGPEPALPR